jgi:hypothetical protein
MRRTIYERCDQMAPLPPDSTARVKVFYHVAGQNHSVQIRYNEPNTLADVASAFGSFIDEISPACFLTNVLDVQFAVSGSNVFNPTTETFPEGWGGSDTTGDKSADYHNFIGRSADGRRTRIGLFGATATVAGGKFRVLAGESEAYAAAIGVLNDAEGVFLSINGFQPVWKEYANLGNNAYWRNKIR